MTWWLLSFADAELPTGQQLLGVAIVRGLTMVDAIERAHKRACNPGGEVQGQGPFEMPTDEVLAPFQERLLTRAEAEEFDEALGKILEARRA